MPDLDLSIPIEIPWRLASTTQHLHEGYPDDTTISLFYYEPNTESLLTDYPEERLIYLKFTVSVSPVHIGREITRELPLNLLHGDHPVIHMVLDIGVTPQPFREGGNRPYFHAASPMRRIMIETGVVGESIFEGESDSVSVGKSASSLHETANSKVSTSSKRHEGAVPLIYRGGTTSSSTSFEGERTVEQFMETTNRDASEERRELLSHHTNINNVLSLLTVKHIGSPYLRFTLSPRPLRQLTIDPTDPNLWYQQLIQYRSSGIEGVQEFFAVVAVPRNSNFCIQTSLRRVFVIDNYPAPPNSLPRYYASVTNSEFAAIMNYIRRKYPIGTPLDEIDIDVLSGITTTGDKIPAISGWGSHNLNFGSGDQYLTIYASSVGGYHSGYSGYQPGVIIKEEKFTIGYKPAYEVELEMLVDQYFENLFTSPLERGVVLSKNTDLRTCFNQTSLGRISVQSDQYNIFPPSLVPFKPKFLGFQSIGTDGGKRSGPSPTAIISYWNHLQEQIMQSIGQLQKNEEETFALNNPKLIKILLRYWADLPEDAPDNISMEKFAVTFKLNPKYLKKFQEAKVKDIKGLAKSILEAPLVEKHNTETENFVLSLDEKQKCMLGVENFSPAQFHITSKEATEISEYIGESLQKEYIKLSNSNKVKIKKD